MPEVAGDAALLVDPHDAGSIANGIQQLVTDSHLATELSGRGRQRALQFSWERAARATLAVYRDTLRT
jgi:glycosyltransferase involved in cell wall biosynthesis